MVRRTRPAVRLLIGPVWAIAKKDFISNISDSRVIVGSAGVTLLLILCTHLSVHEFNARLSNWRVNQELQSAPVSGGNATYNAPGGAFSYRFVVGHEPPIREPESLSAIASGLDGELNRTVTLGQTIQFGPRQDEDAQSRLFGTPDALYAIRLFMSLLALFVAIGTITREREAGVLKALLSFPITRRQLMAGKSIGAALTFLVPFTLAMTAELLYLYGITGSIRTGDQLMRFGMVVCLAFLYGLVFVFLGILISTIVSRSKDGVILALVLWGSLNFVFPEVAILVPEFIAQSPSYTEVNAMLSLNQRRILQTAMRSTEGSELNFDSPEGKRAILEILSSDRDVLDDYISASLNHVRICHRVSLFLPSGALSFGTADLAGTGTLTYRWYLSFLMQQRNEIIAAMTRRVAAPEGENPGVKAMITGLSSERFRPYSFSACTRSVAVSALFLLAWIGASAAGAFWRMQVYDVR
jgi:ABC-type transport system involved in multi-copper enzyme maturation permease subunit